MISTTGCSRGCRRARWVVVVVVLAGSVALGAGCNGQTASSDPPETVPVPRTVRYENGVLTVGDTRLTQLPDHRVSDIFKAPLEWPSAQEIVIETAGEESGLPIVSAVAFSDAASGLTLDQLVMMAHNDLFETIPTSIIDRDTEGGGRRCRLDVRHGSMSDERPQVTSASGVIIVSIGDRPTYGVHLDGSHLDQIQRLTVEMADALCPAGSS